MSFKNDDNFDAANYVRVNDRLRSFRAKYEEGFETTFRTETEKGVSFKALLFRNKAEAELYASSEIAAATGHSFLPHELSGDKVEEYCETVALGRALAKLGFGVEKGLASAEEMEQFERNKQAMDTDESDEGSDKDDEEPPKRKSRFKAASDDDDDRDSDEDDDDEKDGKDSDDDDTDDEPPRTKGKFRFSRRK